MPSRLCAPTWATPEQTTLITLRRISIKLTREDHFVDGDHKYQRYYLIDEHRCQIRSWPYLHSCHPTGKESEKSKYVKSIVFR